MLRDFITGGVNFPWTLVASTAVGVCPDGHAAGLRHRSRRSISATTSSAASSIIVAVTAMAEIARPVRFLNVALGAWVAVSPFLLDGGATAAMLADLRSGWR